MSLVLHGYYDYRWLSGTSFGNSNYLG